MHGVDRTIGSGGCGGYPDGTIGYAEARFLAFHIAPGLSQQAAAGRKICLPGLGQLRGGALLCPGSEADGGGQQQGSW